MSAAAVQPLSNKQKGELMQLGKAAFLVAKERGAVDDDANFDTWRKGQHGEACGREPFGLREALNDDYRTLRGHFLVILGNAEAAFNSFIGTGLENEERRRMAYRLAAQVGSLAKLWGMQRKLTDAQAAKEAWSYCLAIARDKSKGRRLDELAPKEIAQLGFTILNRRSAHAGVGNPANRNTSQATRSPRVSRPPVCSNRLPNAEKPPVLLTLPPSTFRAVPLVSG